MPITLIFAHNVYDYIGDFDMTKEDTQFITDNLTNMFFDDYDKLIQLCDALAVTEVVDMKSRMKDVKNRCSNYPQLKWDMNFQLKKYFETLCEGNIYVIVCNDHSLWEL